MSASSLSVLATASAPIHVAVNGVIAAHAAAFAQDDVDAVDRERAWQSTGSRGGRRCDVSAARPFVS